MLATVVEQVRQLDDHELTEEFRRRELQLRRAEAELAALIAEGERRDIHLADDHHSMKGWLRANANWSNGQVARRRKLARAIDELPTVGEALHAGHIGIAQADELATVNANRRCADQLPASIDVLVEQAEQLSFEDARTCLRRWQALADLDGAHRERDLSRERRTATVTELDGALYLQATGGSAEDAAEIEAIFLDAVEREFRADVAERTRLHGDDAPASLLARTGTQRRFDAVLEIFRRSVSVASGARAPDPLVNVIVDQRTFEEGLADHHLGEQPLDLDHIDLTDRRCETSSGTPIVPDAVIRAALTGHVRRVVLDAAGVVVEMGRKRRLFTGAARDAAKLMSCHCDFPGCDVPGAHTQVDHLREYADGGSTDPANSSLSCGTQNRSKHQRYRAERSPGGQVIYHRADGTPMLPVGRRPAPPPSPSPPPAESDEAFEIRLARERAAALRPAA